MNAFDIKQLITDSHPRLAVWLSEVEPIPLLTPDSVSVLDAVSFIVIEQMLSRKAAATIIKRLQEHAVRMSFSSVAHLSETELRSGGVSGRKAKTIRLFAENYQKNEVEYENWRYLESDELFGKVRSHWGLSDWSASMLAIFYFGLPDVFPYEDGSIKRILEDLRAQEISVHPELVAPYRSYLALYLWKLLDEKLLN